MLKINHPIFISITFTTVTKKNKKQTIQMALNVQITRFILPFFFAFSLASCVSEYPLADDIIPGEFLIVDGIINHNLKGDSTNYVVKISESRIIGSNTAYQVPFTGCTMSILVNDKESVPLIEREKGSYYLYKTDIFKVGNSFKLMFQKGEIKYESAAETLQDTVGIQKLYSELAQNPTAGNAYEIFVDLQDDPKVKNYYKWSVKQWEKQQHCQFCYKANKTPLCGPELFASPGVEITLNNLCQGDCYDILNFTLNNSMSDVFFEGRALIKNSVVTTPYVFTSGALVEVAQSCVTPQYFAFLDLLKSQSVNTGGLADTPAALLTGNVKNTTNSTQKVLGYFSVTNTVSQRIWLDRKSAAAIQLTALSNVNPPLSQPTPTGWPTVACKESKNRTSKKPLGWIN
jgi:Domain of unknown function (DUF4249)